MVACLSCTAESLPRRNPYLSSSTKFVSQHALALLHICANFKQLKQIHAKIICNGLYQDQTVVTNLLRLCSSYGKMEYATLVFDKMSNPPSTFAWNIMIRGHTINNSSQQAILLYNRMICRSVRPDKFTFPFVIKACLASSLVDKGKEVFDKMRVRNVVSWTTVIAGLVSPRQLDVAHVLFEQMPIRNVVSWTAMIDSYARNGRPQEAFELFWRMQLENVRPNEFTLISLLMACTELGSLKLGAWIHDFALKNGFELGIYLGTALIDMYSKCGSLEDAKRVFDEMEIKSLATWNSMITSLGVHGCGEEALSLFENMEMANVQPDAITFVGVLSACIHTNNVEIGRRLFDYMIERYGITPITEHYACMAWIA